MPLTAATTPEGELANATDCTYEAWTAWGPRRPGCLAPTRRFARLVKDGRAGCRA